MRNNPIARMTLVGLTLALTYTQLAAAQAKAPIANKEKPVSNHARGTFDVKVTPVSPDGTFEDATMGRLTIDKQIHGDLEATTKGQMLTAMTEVKGSAGYVAIERVTGTLKGRTGTFFLQHSATMGRGTQHMSITVVPDSGTGQLVGLSGTFLIVIADGKHSYDFEYTLPDAP